MLDYLVATYYAVLSRECVARNNYTRNMMVMPIWLWSAFQLQVFRAASQLAIKAVIRIDSFFGLKEHEKKAQAVLNLLNPNHHLAQLFRKVSSDMQLIMTQSVLFPFLKQPYDVLQDENLWLIEIPAQIAKKEADYEELLNTPTIYQLQQQFDVIADQCESYIEKSDTDPVRKFLKDPRVCHLTHDFLSKEIVSKMTTIPLPNLVKKEEFIKDYLQLLRKLFIQIATKEKIDNIHSYSGMHGWRATAEIIENFIQQVKNHQLNHDIYLLQDVEPLKNYIDENIAKLTLDKNIPSPDMAASFIRHEEVQSFIEITVNRAFNVLSNNPKYCEVNEGKHRSLDNCRTDSIELKKNNLETAVKKYFSNSISNISNSSKELSLHQDNKDYVAFKALFYKIVFDDKVNQNLEDFMKTSPQYRTYYQIIRDCFTLCKKKVNDLGIILIESSLKKIPKDKKIPIMIKKKNIVILPEKNEEVFFWKESPQQDLKKSRSSKEPSS